MVLVLVLVLVLVVLGRGPLMGPGRGAGWQMPRGL